MKYLLATILSFSIVFILTPILMKLAFKYGNHYGKLAVIIGVLIAVPILILPFYPDEVKYIPSFLIPSILSIVFGFFLCKYLHVKQSQGGFRDNLRVGSFAV